MHISGGEFYSQGLISRSELNQVERALAEAIVRVEEDKRWLMESDIAITEATMRDELLRLPGLAIGGYSETGTLLRFNGGAAWSLAIAPKIEKFFLQTFGRGLPVTAFGQTATHDRLRFDHRNAIDVALHPDSNEGRSLLAYLRQLGSLLSHSGAQCREPPPGPIFISGTRPSERSSVQIPKRSVVNGKAGDFITDGAEHPMSEVVNPIKASTIVVVQPDFNGGIEVLMTRRPPEMQFLGGLFGFSGGRSGKRGLL